MSNRKTTERPGRPTGEMVTRLSEAFTLPEETESITAAIAAQLVSSAPTFIGYHSPDLAGCARSVVNAVERLGGQGALNGYLAGWMPTDEAVELVLEASTGHPETARSFFARNVLAALSAAS